MHKLAKRPGVSIVCHQCRTCLYIGKPQEHRPGHAKVQWVPQPKGSRTPPSIPPKRCPFCEGSTGQVGMAYD